MLTSIVQDADSTRQQAAGFEQTMLIQKRAAQKEASDLCGAQAEAAGQKIAEN